MTSNPKSVQNGQRSSPNFLAFWVRRIRGVSAAKSPPKTRASTARPFTSVARVQNTRMVLRRSVCTGEECGAGADRARAVAAAYNWTSDATVGPSSLKLVASEQRLVLAATSRERRRASPTQSCQSQQPSLGSAGRRQLGTG